MSKPASGWTSKLASRTTGKLASARLGRHDARLVGTLNLDPEHKLAGILAPVFALRGADDLGIGDTAAVKELISWSARNGLRVVQILPINESGNDNSPYNLLSAMALEPTTIAVLPAGLPDLAAEDFAAICAEHNVEELRTGPVHYEAVKALKRALLQAAFQRFCAKGARSSRAKAFATFEAEQAFWLKPYALHRALVSWHGEAEVSDAWPSEHRSDEAARQWVEKLPSGQKREFRDRMRFHAYVQWVAWTQWRDVRAHAEREGVALMGDVPVGVSLYSTDVWQEPEIFDLARSSGAPPEKVFKSDPFTEQWGQNWGFPLYHWSRMEQDNFAWWRRRLRLLMSVFHLLRVDHALGFFRIYSFPWRPEVNARFTGLSDEQARELTGGELPHFMDRDDETEDNREFNRRRGQKLMAMLAEETGPHRLIAEDLGEVAPYVRPTLQDLEVPGFKIPQWERRGDRLIPGDAYQRLSLATYATHDHPPLKVLWSELHAASESIDQGVRDAAIHSMWELANFCGQPDFKLPQPFNAAVHDLLIRGLFACNSWLAVHMVTDLFGTADRFNVPGTATTANWTQRMAYPIREWEAAWPEAVARAREAVGESGRAFFPKLSENS